jgi:hypothetical protein
VLTWRRFRQMSWRELSGRSRQQARKWIDRVSPSFGPGGEPRVVWRRVVAGATVDGARTVSLDAAARRFFPGAVDAGVAGALEVDHPEWTRQTLSAAAKAATGRFDLLGYEGLDFGDRIDWHRDPIAGRTAPRLHWSRLDPLDPHVVGDSKLIWELNRHQWLVTLAEAYALTRDPRYAEQALARVEDWIEANPYPIGVNWASSLEVALRLIAWCWALFLLRDAAALTDARFARWRTLMLAHASHVERFLSFYFSPNTHLTGEALGLFYAGVVFADHADAARWRDRGRRILIEQAARQIERDGVYMERATCYHRYTIEIYLHLLILAAHNRIAMPPQVPAAVSRMCRHLIAIAPTAKAMPSIGDADGGWLLPFVRRAPDDCRGVLAVAAVVFDNPEFAWAAGGPAPEILCLLGREGRRRFDRLGARPPAATPSCVFEAGGYAVMRSGWQPDAHQLIVDVGPLGCGVSSGHGHADLLSLQCTAFGEPFLIDPGTYCYTADARWRNYFRSTAAHNTVLVDGHDQAEPAGPFSWATRPAARLRTWQSSAECDLVDADHDGYARLATPVNHRRRVLFVKPYGWVVVDDITGAGEHRIDLRFHFSPRLVTVGPGLWTRASGEKGRGLWLLPIASVPLSARLRQGEESPIDGWYSPAYGVRRPAPVVTYTATAMAPVRITTLIVPVEMLGAHPPALRVTRDPSGDVRAVEFPVGGRTVLVDDHALALAPVTGDLRIA